jgi:hypothetical protein
MAPPRTLMRLGILRAVVYCGRFVPEVPCIFGLGALLTIIGACILAGCYLSRTVDQATASDVNNQSFTFTNGAVFNANLVSLSTTLCFTDNATMFKLSSTGGEATGTNQFDSCILTVITSTYSATAGPQVGEVITLDPSDLKTLTVSNRDLTTTSTAAVAGCSGSGGNGGNGGNGTPATTNDVDNQSFTFSALPSGQVFDFRLQNITTALAFTDDATRFSLTSGSDEATGTSTVGGGVCRLTVAISTYGATVGPQVGDVIRLNPCNFDSTTRRLTVTNNTVTVTSERGVFR